MNATIKILIPVDVDFEHIPAKTITCSLFEPPGTLSEPEAIEIKSVNYKGVEIPLSQPESDLLEEDLLELIKNDRNTPPM